MNVKRTHALSSHIGYLLILVLIVLTSTAAGAASVTLRWDANSPAPDGYRIFARKSGQAYDYSRPIWEGSSTSCTIISLENQTEYYFVVRAFDGSLESASSGEVKYTPSTSSGSNPDTTPPAWNGATTGVGLARDTATSGSVVVEFDTARDAANGTNLRFNVYYAVTENWNNTDWSNNNVIVDATVGAGSTFSHAVKVSGLSNGVGYTFGVRAEDQSGNEDTNTNKLTATPTTSQNSSGSGTDLDAKFVESTLGSGMLYYTDRAYKLTSIPPSYVGMDTILTPNDERDRTDAGGYVTFEMPYDGTVYVAYDSRATHVPDWMSGFSDTGDRIYTSLSSQPYMKIYEKWYAAGAIVNLGANKASGFSGGTISNYMVFYSPGGGSTGGAPSLIIDTRFGSSTLGNGIRYYTDRDYTLTGVPSAYVGMDAILTPNDERDRTDASGYLTFQMPYAGTIYVAYDSRATHVPNWMSGFSDTGQRIYTSLSSQPYLKVFQRTYASGATVNLGANKAAGFSGSTISNYMVFY